MSVIYYKFASALTFTSCKFDGMALTCFDLKREIMINKKLGNGNDIDLAVFNANTMLEYKDDEALIPRNTQVIVKRSPAAGKVGTASKYIIEQVAPTRNDSNLQAAIASKSMSIDNRYYSIN